MNNCIEEVYEKYKHLDILFSDEKWTKNSRLDGELLHELWMAMKKDLQKNKKAKCMCTCCQHKHDVNIVET